MKKIVVSMPVFNESQIIESVILDYLNIEGKFELLIVAVDDNSTDSTYQILNTLREKYPNRLFLNQNVSNLGHGPTFCNALALALKHEPTFVVSCDGDGPISREDLKILLELEEKCDVLEVIRTERAEPFFRKLTSFTTRLLVFTKCGTIPLDANTPIRMFNPETLESLLPQIRDSRVPNLLISIIIRQKGLSLSFFRISVLERKLHQQGTMWGQSLLPRSFPSSRFLKFSFASLLEILRFKVK